MIESHRIVGKAVLNNSKTGHSSGALFFGKSRLHRSLLGKTNLMTLDDLTFFQWISVNLPLRKSALEIVVLPMRPVLAFKIVTKSESMTNDRNERAGNSNTAGHIY